MSFFFCRQINILYGIPGAIMSKFFCFFNFYLKKKRRTKQPQPFGGIFYRHFKCQAFFFFFFWEAGAIKNVVVYYSKFLSFFLFPRRASSHGQALVVYGFVDGPLWFTTVTTKDISPLGIRRRKSNQNVSPPFQTWKKKKKQNIKI